MPKQCKAKIKTGKQCGNNAISGTDFCYLRTHCGSAVQLNKRFFNAVRNHWITAVSLLGVLITSIGFLLYLQDKSAATQESRLNATSGVLSASATNPIENISVGSKRFFLTSKDGVFLRDKEAAVLSLRRVNNSLLVSTQIMNNRGDLIAELKDNEWVHQARPAIFDRNYTDSVLEIKDNTGKIALQVVDFGDTVHVAGIFRCRDGSTRVLGPLNKEKSALISTPPGAESDYRISPICEYPSSRHLGMCPGVQALGQTINRSSVGGYMISSIDICSNQNAAHVITF
ncbi:MAG TPA: hypothetical protein VNA19_06530 [Pyrinomonadaceae bacterium]|jgi:uncharacterized membrane protein YsdA (DUF1294 family)|nr:hypothetical protein [Pyrinomonadaceae bacterium]